jgi:hypothetical protein
MFVIVLLFLAACWPMGHMSDRDVTGIQQSPAAITPAETADLGGDFTVSYQADIQPIFNRACLSCHGGQAGLYLESFDRLMLGSTAGAVVIPGDAQASKLVQRIQGVGGTRMPLSAAPLAPEEIEIIMKWIDEGSPNN